MRFKEGNSIIELFKSYYPNDMNLKNILNFTAFTHKFQQVVRTIYVTGIDRDENDLEHVGQLALLAWYIAESEKLDLDQEKLIKYALAHDLVETYAGDTYFHTTDQALKDSKAEREANAAKRIRTEFSEFDDLHELIEAYEEKKDKEARFIYALDKMIPVLNIYLDHGRSWKRDKVTLEMIRKKDEKIAESPELINAWMEFTKLLEEGKKDLFI